MTSRERIPVLIPRLLRLSSNFRVAAAQLSRLDAFVLPQMPFGVVLVVCGFSRPLENMDNMGFLERGIGAKIKSYKSDEVTWNDINKKHLLSFFFFLKLLLFPLCLFFSLHLQFQEVLKFFARSTALSIARLRNLRYLLANVR
jgi:hypothetical protein